MKFPESTDTMRSAGRNESSSQLSTRGSIRLVEERSGVSTSRQRDACLVAESSIGPRGINGEINELLFPLQHGTLWYTGISVVPPLVVHSADRAESEEYELAAKRLRGRLKELPETPPIRFRRQNGGDYDGRLELRSDIAPGQRGPQIHVDDS